MKEYIIKIGDEPDIMGNYGLKEKPKELVRCKDCKRWNEVNGSYYGRCEHVKRLTPFDWFCSDGKRD